MIARLKGIVEELGDDWLIVDVNGVGYHVFASSRTLGSMIVGEAVTVVIETHVREDHIHLYGFADTTERDWFKLLTTVQGVGAKVGLGIQSALSPDEISQAIAAQDKATITRAPGVGPKLGARIVSELKDKVGAIALNQTLAAATGKSQSGGVSAKGSAVSDATSALVNLGYNASQALGAVSEAAGELGEGADVSALIRGGLSRLAPADTGPGARG